MFDEVFNIKLEFVKSVGGGLSLDIELKHFSESSKDEILGGL